jgi:hypothetical protein
MAVAAAGLGTCTEQAVALKRGRYDSDGAAWRFVSS